MIWWFCRDKGEDADSEIDMMSFALEGKYTFDMGKGFFPFFELGLGYMLADLDESGNQNNDGFKFVMEGGDKAFLSAGLGCEKFFTDQFSMRLEANYALGFNVILGMTFYP